MVITRFCFSMEFTVLASRILELCVKDPFCHALSYNCHFRVRFTGNRGIDHLKKPWRIALLIPPSNILETLPWLQGLEQWP